ncbi:NAD(P)-binding domain-containing protein [Candidatus Pacearchaeota archaeon]|nr:NAD(P)-binding domain-containing protein [Candidatus Pacearchaeota archaeon]
MKTQTLGFIGGGRITKIFLQAFKNQSVLFDSIKVFDTNQEVLSALKDGYPEIEISDSVTEPASQEIVIIAVHPPVVMETLENIKGSVADNTTMLSLAPKITIDKIANSLSIRKVVRMIPNATSYINKGYNPITFHDAFMIEEKELFKDTFKALGKTFEVDEAKLEGYAIVSAMLPTYFWFQWKAMEEIAIKTGLTEIEAEKTIKSTLKKSIALLYDSGLKPEEVIDLIPVKPIIEHEAEIKSIYETRLLGLYDKIKP